MFTLPTNIHILKKSNPVLPVCPVFHAYPVGRGGRYYRKNYRSPIYQHYLSYRQIIDIENVHPISSDKHCSKNKSKCVLYPERI